MANWQVMSVPPTTAQMMKVVSMCFSSLAPGIRGHVGRSLSADEMPPARAPACSACEIQAICADCAGRTCAWGLHLLFETGSMVFE
jgi:hypothetical protein